MPFDLEAYLKKPKDYMSSADLEDIFAFLQEANEYYRNTSETLLSDELYDLLYEYAKKKNPKHPFFKQVGAPVKEKVELPEWMGSLDKIRDDPKALLKWKKDYPSPYVTSDKLDGISGMFAIANGQINLYTRGDGKYGQLINHVLPFIQSSYQATLLPKEKTLIRGEFIISKANWKKIAHRGANARNVVAGQLNAKQADPEIAQYLDFVAYELVAPKKPFSEGLEYIKNLGFKVVPWKVIEAEELTNDYLSNHLLQRREASLYEIDGIVVRDNLAHNIVKGKNPKYAFAYKTILTHDKAEVLVLAVEWNVSKDGLIKPTVLFNPVSIAGVKIQKATGFNASFIESNKIAPGAKVIIIRSGDVIPHIVEVTTPAKAPSFPDMPYEWTETHVDIKVKGSADNKQMQLRQLEHFVNTLDIKHIGPGVLKKMMDKGVDKVEDLFALEKKDLLLLEGIQEKGAEKIYTSLRQAIANVPCARLMAASNLFGRGFGEKRLQLILDHHPSIQELKPLAKLETVEGVGAIIAKQFLESLPAFYAFAKRIGYSTCGVVKAKSPKPDSPGTGSAPSGPSLTGQTFVFTGFRDKQLEERVTDLGGKVTGSVSKNTTLVVAADPQESSTKLQKARDLGIPILSKEAFLAQLQ